MVKRTLRGIKPIRQNRLTFRKEVIGYKSNPKNPNFRKIKIKGKNYERVEI